MSTKYAGRDFDTIQRDLLAYIRRTRPNDINSFFEGDGAKIILEMIAYVGDVLSFSIDRVSEEAFLPTMRLRDSALRHARGLAYPVATSTTASGFMVPDSFEAIPAVLRQRNSTNAVQTVTIVSGTGNFNLTYAGQTTGNIAHTASNDTVEAALWALTTVGTNNVSVAGLDGGPWVVTFQNTLGFRAVIAMVPGDAGPVVSVTTTTTGVLASYAGRFLKGTSFSAGGVSWEIPATVMIAGLAITPDNYETLFRVPVRQGTATTEQFSGAGDAFQRVTTAAENVAESSLVVRTGGLAATPWTRVASLALADANSNSYSVVFDSDGRGIVSFGDPLLVNVPSESDSIFLQFLVTAGTKGNVGASALRATLTATALDGTPSGTVVSVVMRNIVETSGGTDAETLEEIRTNIPKWVRTVDKAITQEDYNTLASVYESGNGAVRRAVAYLLDGTVLYQTGGDPITVSSPVTLLAGTSLVIAGATFTTTKTLQIDDPNGLLFVNPNAVVVYAWGLGVDSFAASSDVLLADLREYLQKRSVITTTLFTRPGRVRPITLNLGVVRYAPPYSESVVSAAITAATKAFFVSDAIQPGKAFRLSDYYNVIEDIPGVSDFVIQTPSADVFVERDELPTIGNLLFTLSRVNPAANTSPDYDAFGNELYR